MKTGKADEDDVARKPDWTSRAIVIVTILVAIGGAYWCHDCAKTAAEATTADVTPQAQRGDFFGGYYGTAARRGGHDSVLRGTLATKP